MFLILTLGNLKVFVPESIRIGPPISEHVREPEDSCLRVDVFSDGVGSFVVNCNGLL